MNKRPIRLFAVAISILLLVSVFTVVTVNVGESSVSEFEPKGIDVDIERCKAVETEPLGEPEPAHHSYWNVGDSAVWSTWNDLTATVIFTWFELYYIGTSVEIWVQRNIKFPTSPPDPRNGIGGNPGPTKPTTTMCQYLADQFEQNILPKESQFFGAPIYHNGSSQHVKDYIPWITPDYYLEPTGRAVILVANVRDENYYDYTYPYYIIGIHIGDYESYWYDRNVVTLDAVNWFHGLGSADNNWGDHFYWPTNSFHNHTVLSPYAYDSTLAHEWQHLLHYELCPGDARFMNEGCSMYAELLCGYGIDPDYPNSYFATPDNSLTEWGDQGGINILADYGNAGLWCIYLADRYGAQYLRLYFRLGAPDIGIHGIDGINYALYFLHYNERFPDVYRDWKLANLIRADNPGAGKYNYKSLNLNDPVYIPVRMYEISGLPVPWTRASTYFGNTTTILGYDTGISKVARWGTDYIMFDNWKCPGHIYFDGDDVCVPPPPHLWTMTGDGWYSGTGEDLAEESIVGNAYVNPSDPTLTVVTKYGLETLWDYGFVQVSTDSGTTWTSLANAYTTYDHDPDAHPDIVANLPGLTGYNPDWPSWTTMSFDLTAYAGQTVMFGFRYMTDWAMTYEGWWINSATVSGTALTLTPWVPTPPASFQVTTVSVFVIDHMTLYVPNDMPLDSPTNTGTSVEYAMKPNYVVLVVTPTMQKGMADYQFEVTKLPIVSRGHGKLVPTMDGP